MRNDQMLLGKKFLSAPAVYSLQRRITATPQGVAGRPACPPRFLADALAIRTRRKITAGPSFERLRELPPKTFCRVDFELIRGGAFSKALREMPRDVAQQFFPERIANLCQLLANVSLNRNPIYGFLFHRIGIAPWGKGSGIVLNGSEAVIADGNAEGSRDLRNHLQEKNPR